MSAPRLCLLPPPQLPPGAAAGGRAARALRAAWAVALTALTAASAADTAAITRPASWRASRPGVALPLGGLANSASVLHASCAAAATSAA